MGGKQLPETMTLIRDNIMQYDNPLAVSAKENAEWAADLHLPKKGPVLFYTGGEYQLLPFMDSLVTVMDIVDPGTPIFGWMMSMRDLVHKSGMAPEKIFASVFAQDKKRFFSINRKAALILKALGYELAYDGENEIYSGALLHELGFEDALGEYAKRVSSFINNSGAKTVVCMSPHAAEMFSLIYPNYGDFPDIEVKTFVEMVHAKRDMLPKNFYRGLVTLHDSCRMAREMDVVDEFREVLDAMNVRYEEPFRWGKWSTCCGGPIKTTYAELSHKLSQKRVDELAATGAQIALLSCPYCLSALKGAKPTNHIEIMDFVEFLAKGYDL
ncbi:MAG: (Fe-S)-binding protein [Peptococcaceae bacterium]|nr:(Fe-S)-binding protein [Peptococcaceae bacterium]